MALPLTNDIAGICALLALFQRSPSVALLTADDDGATPAFCSARLDTSTMTGSDVNLQARTTDKALVYLRTSGSTGEPKWVVITRDALILNADGVRDRMSLSTEDYVLIPVPVYHMYGLGAALPPSLLGGSSMRVSAKRDPLSIRRGKVGKPDHGVYDPQPVPCDPATAPHCPALSQDRGGHGPPVTGFRRKIRRNERASRRALRIFRNGGDCCRRPGQ